MRPLRTLILAAYRLTVLVAAVGLTVLNVRLYHGPTSAYARPALGPDVVAQLESLRERLDDGAGDDAQALFPEGYFFLHVLYGLSWVEVGLRETSGGPAWARALSEARWANARLASADGRAPFAPELQPAYVVFYTGWRAWLGGGIQLLQPAEMRPADEREAYEAEVAEHDGLLPHRTRPSTTFALEGPRGTSQSLSARFLIEIDPALGGDFYTAYRARFVRPFLGVPGVVE